MWQLLNKENLRLGLRRCWFSQNPHWGSRGVCVVWVLEQCPCCVPRPLCLPVHTGSGRANRQFGSGPAGGCPRSTRGTRTAWQAHLLWPAIGMALGPRNSVHSALGSMTEGYPSKAGELFYCSGKLLVLQGEKQSALNHIFTRTRLSLRHQNKPELKTEPHRLPGHRCHKRSCKEQRDFINQTLSQGGWHGSCYLSDHAQALQTLTQGIGLPKRQATCSSRAGSARSPSQRVPFATQMCCQTRRTGRKKCFRAEVFIGFSDCCVQNVEVWKIKQP